MRTECSWVNLFWCHLVYSQGTLWRFFNCTGYLASIEVRGYDEWCLNIWKEISWFVNVLSEQPPGRTGISRKGHKLSVRTVCKSAELSEFRWLASSMKPFWKPRRWEDCIELYTRCVGCEGLNCFMVASTVDRLFCWWTFLQYFLTKLFWFSLQF
jgi:hypothetical protein